jgi:asparagine synthase (glutamine-hydrolysing)
MTTLFGVAELHDGAFRQADRVVPGWPAGPRAPRQHWMVCGPVADESPNFLFLGRLDNRHDLAARFGASPTSTDATIVRLGFSALGAGCADLFEGDWVFAAWDPHARRLVLSRDPYGNSAWFYHRAGDLLAFSNSLPSLVGLLRPTAVDGLFVAGQLTALNCFSTGRTAYRDIARVLPGHTVTVTADHVRLERYWRIEDTPVVDEGVPAVHFEEFAATLQRAVRRRLWGAHRVTSTLSGGLDSSSVTALAAEVLGEDGQRLLALTSTPVAEYRRRVGAGGPGDESVLASETARRFNNIDHSCFDATEVSPLDGIRRMLTIQGQPGIAAANNFWILKLLDLARAAGTDTLLTAQMGNAVWSWYGQPPNWRAPFRLGWRAGLVATASWGCPSAVSAYRRLRQPTALSRSGQPPWAAYSAIRPEFAAEVSLLEQMAEAKHDPSFRYAGRSDRAARFALLKPACSPVGAFWSHLGQAFDLNIADPSQDKSLLRVSWAMPMQLWWQDMPRWVIRQVMVGRLPDAVRLHPGGHFQSADLGIRLREETRALGDAVQEMGESTLASDCVDVERCRDLVRRLSTSHPPSLLELKAVLLRGLDTGLFLAGVERRIWV